MKYLIALSPEGPRVLIFCAPTTHREEAAAHPGWKPLSAGFVQFHGAASVSCYGRSDSLNLSPADYDGSLIMSALRVNLVLNPPPSNPV